MRIRNGFEILLDEYSFHHFYKLYIFVFEKMFIVYGLELQKKRDFFIFGRIEKEGKILNRDDFYSEYSGDIIFSLGESFVTFKSFFHSSCRMCSDTVDSLLKEK